MKEIQFIIVGSNKHDDLLKMKILEVFNYSDYETKTIPAYNKWGEKYCYCYILKTIYD